MKVAIDCRIESGGVARYARDLARGLRACTDVEVSPITRSDMPRALSAPFAPAGRYLAARLARRMGAGVYHSAHLELPRGLPMPAVLTIHDAIPLEWPASLPSALKRAYFRRLLEQSFRRADLVIVPSERTRRGLAILGLEGSKVRVVPPGASGVFRPPTAGERERARNRFAGGRPYVGAIYSRRAHKNGGLLVELAAALAESGAALVSPGNETVAGISFAGRLDDEGLRSFYAGAEAFVLPSFVEGFGLPALEAIACGTPVACSAEIGALDHLGGAAATFAPASLDGALAALLPLLSDTARRDDASARGLEVARTLTVERMAIETEVLYRAVAAPAGMRP